MSTSPLPLTLAGVSSVDIASTLGGLPGIAMAFASLRDFLRRLEAENLLVRTAAPVSPKLEMTEIGTRLIAAKGPAVLFEKPVREDGTPYPMPVLINLFGTLQRIALGLGRKPEELREIGEALAFLRQPEPPGGRGGGLGPV